MTLDTRDDRTVFFDLLPIFFKQSGFSFQLKVYTVPGQPMHELTRRLVLKAVDGVAFIADSQIEQQRANEVSYRNLCENLDSLHLPEVPVVVQYNKRDLPDAVELEALPQLGRDPQAPQFPAVAVAGDGVFDTFFHLLEQTWASVDERLGLSRSFGISGVAFVDAVRRHMNVGQAPAE